MFGRPLLVGSLFSLLALPARAQSPGTAEWYVKDADAAMEAKSYWMAASSYRQAAMLRPENADYHFRLGVALAMDKRAGEAREAFEKAAALKPELRAEAAKWLPAAPAPRTEPAAAPQNAPPAAAPAAGAPFRSGDAVEIQYRPGEWFPGVVTSVSAGPCPSYRVRADVYGRGDPSELAYACGSVRAPTGIAPPVRECGGSNPNCTPTSPPPVGTYLCHEMVWQGSGKPLARKDHPSLHLLSGGRYRLYDNGATGRYAYDARTYRITFTGGDLAGRGAEASYGLDVRTPEITVAFPTEYTRRTGNAPPTWQCGLGR